MLNKPHRLLSILLLSILLLNFTTTNRVAGARKNDSSAPVAPLADVTTRVSIASDGTQGNNQSQYPSISADGRYVAFSSYASNLVSGDTNEVSDVFVHDRQTGDTNRVSIASDGSQGTAGS